MVYVRNALPAVDAEMLVVPWFEGDEAAALPEVGTATGGEIQRALGSKELSGRAYELLVAPIRDESWKARAVALIGAGRPSEFGGDIARRIAAAAGLALKQRRVARAAFVLRTGATVADEAELAQAVAEGLKLSEFNAGIYKTADLPPADAPAWTIVGAADCANAVERGRLLGQCTNLAREITNEPGNRLTPQEFARRSREILAGTSASFEVLDETQLERLGMGMLLGVA